MRPLSVTPWLPTLLLLAGCTPPPPGISAATAADVAAVKQLVAEFDRCARDGDLETFMTYSMEDVVSMAPDQPAIVGKDALREWYRDFYGTFNIEMQHDPLETHAVGSVLIHRGNGHGVLTPKAGGAPMPFDNKYLFVLRRQADGSLKVWRAVFNSNAPPS